MKLFHLLESERLDEHKKIYKNGGLFEWHEENFCVLLKMWREKEVGRKFFHYHDNVVFFVVVIVVVERGRRLKLEKVIRKIEVLWSKKVF